MMPLDVVTIEEPTYQQVLKTPAKSVQFPLNQDTKTLISAMKIKLQELGGVGLAAPQVNVPLRITVIRISEEAAFLRPGHNKAYPLHVLINPTYKSVDGSAIQADFEACYSVTSKAGKVPRYEQIKLRYYDEEGILHEQQEQGFYARVLQHEIDHLDGILILDRLTPDCPQGTAAEMMVLRRAGMSDEQKAVFDQAVTRKK